MGPVYYLSRQFKAVYVVLVGTEDSYHYFNDNRFRQEKRIVFYGYFERLDFHFIPW